jgi:hypothetical protein
MKYTIQMTKDSIPRLLIKYSIVVIILELVTRFAMVHILRFYQNTFPLENNTDSSTIESLNNVVRASVVMILNILTGIVLLLDLDRKKVLTWVLLGLTLLNPWMSIIFFLILKAAEIKNYA